jgi:hypothetical protein
MTLPTDITKIASEPPRVFISYSRGNRLRLFGGQIIPPPVSVTKPRPPDGLRTPAEAARKLHCSVKTLNGYVKSGALKYVAIGHGRKRPRKMFTDADLNEFIANQTRKVTPCPSTAGRTRLTGTSISGAEVIDFRLPRKRPTSGKQKK